jgi:hypothetical protein
MHNASRDLPFTLKVIIGINSQQIIIYNKKGGFFF